MCPLTSKNRIKSFILGRKNVLVSVNPNSKLADDAPCIAKNMTKLEEFSSPIKQACKSPNLESVSEVPCLTASKFQVRNVGTDTSENFDDLPYFAMPKEEKHAMSYFRGFVVHKFFLYQYPELKDTTASAEFDD